MAVSVADPVRAKTYSGRAIRRNQSPIWEVVWPIQSLRMLRLPPAFATFPPTELNRLSYLRGRMAQENTQVKRIGLSE